MKSEYNIFLYLSFIHSLQLKSSLLLQPPQIVNIFVGLILEFWLKKLILILNDFKIMKKILAMISCGFSFRRGNGNEINLRMLE